MPLPAPVTSARVIPERFLDRVRDDLRLLDQALAVLGMVRQVVEHVAELAPCRVESGEHQHDQHVENLFVGQRPLVGVARVHQVGGEVAAPGLGFAAALLHRVDPVLTDARARARHPLQRVWVTAETGEEVLDPLEEVVSMCEVDADHA
jgi:hypothetical protein